MKITAIIAHDERPEGWPECYTARTWNATPEEQRAQIQTIVDKFNANLRPGELPRRVLSITSEEIDEADAFNMGMCAYHQLREREENYWPREHANFQHWCDGWE